MHLPSVFLFVQNCSLTTPLSTEAFSWTAHDSRELHRVFGANGHSSQNKRALEIRVTLDASSKSLTFDEGGDGDVYTVPRHGMPCDCIIFLILVDVNAVFSVSYSRFTGLRCELTADTRTR